MFYTKSRIPIFNLDFTHFAIWRLFKISLSLNRMMSKAYLLKPGILLRKTLEIVFKYNTHTHHWELNEKKRIRYLHSLVVWIFNNLPCKGILQGMWRNSLNLAPSLFSTRNFSKFRHPLHACSFIKQQLKER